MFALENNGPAHLVKVVSCDYPDFDGARAVAQLVNNHIMLVAECRDGKQRSYHSTRIVYSFVFDNEDEIESCVYKTRSGKEWVLA